MGCAPMPMTGAPCDPVCQGPCKCDERCTVSGATTVCEAQPAMRKKPGEQCDADVDTCEPGSICFRDTCAAACYRFCRADTNCKNAHCNVKIPSGGNDTG